MFEKGCSSNRQKMSGWFFQQVVLQGLGWLLY